MRLIGVFATVFSLIDRSRLLTDTKVIIFLKKIRTPVQVPLLANVHRLARCRFAHKKVLTNSSIRPPSRLMV